MANRFKSKRKLKLRYRILLFLSFACIGFLFIFHFLYNTFSLKMDNKQVMSFLIDYNLNTKDENKVLYDILNLSSTDFLLKYTLGFEGKEREKESEEVSGIEANYIEDPYDTKINDPVVYIYNTHQTEGYQRSNNASYNITPSVLMASYILRESLNDLGMPTLVETNDITEILRIHSWQYKYSYQASRILLEDAIRKNAKLTYFIDLHRDAMNYEVTTATINEKKYAKILFVIGKDHENYQKNLELAEKINEELKKFSPEITRGISIKGGSGVNGIYNQDISPNAILIELGGQYNSITEINNTIEILSKALFNSLKGEI